MDMVLLTALGVGGATVIGAAIGFLFKSASHKLSDMILSFAAGVMLSAAVLGLVLPGMVNTFNVIVLRTFIQSTIPVEMFDAAAIDGANEFRVFRSIVLPLSKAGLATIALFVMVGKWNEWFTGMLYIENPKLVPVQTMLTRIQQQLDFIKNNSDYASTMEGQKMLMSMPTEQTRMAILVLSTLPIIFAYPFFQRFFIQGLTIGSVKG